MRAEVRFDHSRAEPNRFASRFDKSRLVVAVDPDVSEALTTPESVNKALRALIGAVPTAKRRYLWQLCRKPTVTGSERVRPSATIGKGPPPTR